MRALAETRLPEEQSVVYLVDDDADVRESLKMLLESVSLRCETFSSTKDFLERAPIDAASCLVLDVRLPGPSGLDFQAELAQRHIDIPIVFITGHGDIRMSVRAIKGGAVEFLTKPVREQDLLDAVRTALDQDRTRREYERKRGALRAKFALLSDREREVMSFVIRGLLNKQIAGEMRLSEVTVKVHRHKLMRKLAAKSVPDLVRMAEVLNSNGFAKAS
ncbi:MAG: response regulator transcription factor [Alphaproteobacteria bacterium]|nr:response regulator transcription factor [Alphaproteobacteria bacterium]